MKRKNRKPSFFWQGVLILAPVLVLAKLGTIALRQDRKMVEHEAQLRAQEIAEKAAEAIWTDLQTPTNAASLRVDRNGALMNPRPYRRTLEPQPLDFSQLSGEQRALWETGQVSLARVLRGANGNDMEEIHKAVTALENFVGSKPPTNFAVAAHFVAGKLLMEPPLHMPGNAAQHFEAIISNYPGALTESGLPALPLAQFRLYETVRYISGQVLAASNAFGVVLEHPNLLTSHLLTQLWPDTNVNVDWSQYLPPLPSDEARRRIDRERQQIFAIKSNAWQNWNTHERLREIHSALPIGLRLGGTNETFLFWLTLPAGASHENRSQPGNTNEQRWLLVHLPQDDGATVLCRTEATVNEIAVSALQRVRMPEYFDASVYLADAAVVPSNQLEMIEHVISGKGGGQFWRRSHASESPAALASAERGNRFMPASIMTTVSSPVSFGNSLRAGQAVAVSIHLVSPELLYAQQKERATLFRLLIGASALASVIGFFFAWRAFRKQLQLAEMKSNFVSSVSHELRAPIASVRLMAEGLERGKISELTKQREYFRFITQECRRLSSMIENVLDFARIEQGRKEYDFEPTDVTALVNQTVRLMEPYAQERGVKLSAKAELDGGVSADEGGASLSSARRPMDQQNPQALGPTRRGEDTAPYPPFAANIDGQSIQQALVNLIDNAIKHSPAGKEVNVSLSLNPQLSTLNLSVSDSGPGIPATERERIFERFYRLGSELRRETAGVGIGLSIVKHIVEAHGGRVRVESEVGKGSQFVIELPLTAETQRRREES